MAAVADFVVYDAVDEPKLIVEAKNKPAASRDWASQLRHNLFAYVTLLPRVPFFLLALPDHFYLWKNAFSADMLLPNYEIDANQTLQNYATKLRTPLANLGANSFNLLVHAWLDDIINLPPDSPRLIGADRWLMESGLYDAIRQGTIKSRKQL
jgi:hypothetical protein